MTNPSTLLHNSRLIVVKIGSALLVDGTGKLRRSWLSALAEDISYLRADGKSIVIVSSGAIALGRAAMGIDYRSASASLPLEYKQAASAVGQIALMQSYIAAFATHDATVAQILLTPKDTEHRRSHLNARATIHALLKQNILPVINENDTVSTAEIRFGDNDRLASRVAQMIGADVVLQLSTTDGLYTADPRIDPSATHIPVVERLDAEHAAMAGDALPGVSTGGMKSKLDAAKIATESGVAMMIGKGEENHALRKIADGGARATVFLPTDQPRSARKKWITAHVRPKGTLHIDAGACSALRDGRSLLPAGITGIEGDFERGDAIALCDPSGGQIGIGLAAYDAKHAVRIAGRKSADIADILGYSYGDEMVHRDDLAITF